MNLLFGFVVGAASSYVPSRDDLLSFWQPLASTCTRIFDLM
jgi:hypothetical protein